MLRLAAFFWGALCASCQCETDDGGDGGASTTSTTVSTSTSGSTSTGCQADTATDPLNCGMCGNACGVGSCVAGVCQKPEVLAANLATLAEIATDGASLFIAGGGHAMAYLDGAIYSLPFAGGTPTVLQAPVPAAEAIALDGGKVVFTSVGTSGMNFGDGYLASLPKTGGASTVVAPAQSYCRDLLVRGADYFVANAGKSPAFSDGSVRWWNGTTMSDLATNLASPGGLALDGDVLYWFSNSNQANVGQVQRRALNGGTTEVVLSGLDRPSALGVFNGRVYVATSERIESFAPQDPASRTVFADEGRNAANFAADATDLYWTEPSGRVMRQSFAKGPAIILVDGLIQAFGILLHEDHVYFTDRGTGIDDASVQRIRK